MAEISSTIRRQVAVIADRSGSVEFVVVGDASRIYLPDVGRVRAAQAERAPTPPSPTSSAPALTIAKRTGNGSATEWT